MVATVKSSSWLAGHDSVRQLDLADVDRIADLQPVERDVDFVRDVRRVADQLELVLDDVEHAAALEARRLVFIVEAHGHRDVNLGVLADAQEIDVDRPARDRVEVDRLRQGPVRLALEVDHHDRVHEVAGREHLGQKLLLDMDREGLFLFAVNHGGYPSIAAQCSGGSLASPVARFGGQRQLFAHFACLRLIKMPRATPPGMTMAGERAP